jgi:dihydropteroate synthase
VTINVSGQLHDLSHPRIMGILNMTPDSFYSDSRVPSVEEALAKAEVMVNQGAWCLDIGGYSSRPGAEDVSEQVELSRVLDPINAIRNRFPELPISIDTFRANVAKAAIAVGANIVNDISGGHLDDQMLDFVSEVNVPFIAMHMRGTPQDMKKKVQYDDLVTDMIRYFSEIKTNAYKKGINDIIIDPGFGFAKTLNQNFEVLEHLKDFELLECPILIGVSRKSMIFKSLNITPDEALNGTTALNSIALQKGANILRVHDVKEANEVVQLYSQLKENK